MVGYKANWFYKKFSFKLIFKGLIYFLRFVISCLLLVFSFSFYLCRSENKTNAFQIRSQRYKR
jgi:hypothetical protein